MLLRISVDILLVFLKTHVNMVYVTDLLNHYEQNLHPEVFVQNFAFCLVSRAEHSSLKIL